MRRDSFIFFSDWYDALHELPGDLKGEAYEAVVSYGINGEFPDNLSPMVELALRLIKGTIDRNAAAYEATKEARREAGRKGAEVRWQANGKNGKAILANGKNGKANFANGKNGLYVYDNVSVIENDDVIVSDDVNGNGNGNVYANGNGNERPTVQQIGDYMSEYAASKNHALDITLPDKFYNYYATRNWHYKNKQPLKDWKAAARNWVLKDIKESQSFLNERKERWIQDESNLGYFNKWILNEAPYVAGHLDEPEGANGAMNTVQLSTLMKSHDSLTIKNAVTAIEGNREQRKNIGSLFATLTNYLNQ